MSLILLLIDKIWLGMNSWVGKGLPAEMWTVLFHITSWSFAWNLFYFPSLEMGGNLFSLIPVLKYPEDTVLLWSG